LDRSRRRAASLFASASYDGLLSSCNLRPSAPRAPSSSGGRRSSCRAAPAARGPSGGDAERTSTRSAQTAGRTPSASRQAPPAARRAAVSQRRESRRGAGAPGRAGADRVGYGKGEHEGAEQRPGRLLQHRLDGSHLPRPSSVKACIVRSFLSSGMPRIAPSSARRGGRRGAGRESAWEGERVGRARGWRGGARLELLDEPVPRGNLRRLDPRAALAPVPKPLEVRRRRLPRRGAAPQLLGAGATGALGGAAHRRPLVGFEVHGVSVQAAGNVAHAQDQAQHQHQHHSSPARVGRSRPLPGGGWNQSLALSRGGRWRRGARPAATRSAGRTWCPRSGGR